MTFFLKTFITAVLPLLLLSSLATPVHALKKSRLWLSPKQQHLMPSLIAAAHNAEAYAGCVEIVDGQYDSSRSTKDQSIFRIICRNPEGQSFLVRVTGEKGEKIAELEEIDKAAAAAEGGLEGPNAKEAGGGSEAEALPAGINTIEGWETCLQGIEKKTENMVNRVVYDNPPPIPVINRFKESIFEVDFDAQNMRGVNLKYHAVCKVLTSGLYKITILSRDNLSPDNLSNDNLPHDNLSNDHDALPAQTGSVMKGPDGEGSQSDDNQAAMEESQQTPAVGKSPLPSADKTVSRPRMAEPATDWQVLDVNNAKSPAVDALDDDKADDKNGWTVIEE